jgi:hypothetical protein
VLIVFISCSLFVSCHILRSCFYVRASIISIECHRWTDPEVLELDTRSSGSCLIFAPPSRRGVASAERVSSTTFGVDVCENGPNGMISPHEALSRAVTRKRLVWENIGRFHGNPRWTSCRRGRKFKEPCFGVIMSQNHQDGIKVETLTEPNFRPLRGR